MRRLSDALRQDSGFSLLWTAMVLFFLMGSAALAVDASEFWQQARVEQTTADLACLAGVRHAPTNAAQAVTKAAEFLRPNHPDLRTMSTTPDSGSAGPGTNVFTAGNFRMEVQTPWSGKSTKMRVRVEQTRATRFGRVLGVSSAVVSQEAYCEVGSPLNLGDLPLALDVAGADECRNTGQNCTVKFTGPDCTVLNGPGNCGSIDVPRHDDPPGSGGYSSPNEYEINLALGANWDLVAGNTAICRNGANTNEPCGRMNTVTGNKPPQLRAGLITGVSGGFPGRLARPNPHNVNTYPGGIRWDHHFLGWAADCTSGVDCADGSGQMDTTVPAQVTRVTDCTDPRWSAIPVIQNFGVGSNPVSYVRSEFAWIQEPDMSPGNPGQLTDPNHPGESEFQGGASPNVQIVAIRILTFPLGPDTPIDNLGECGFYQFQPGAPAAVRLVQS